jgi:hypothetical protein
MLGVDTQLALVGLVFGRHPRWHSTSIIGAVVGASSSAWS